MQHGSYKRFIATLTIMAGTFLLAGGLLSAPSISAAPEACWGSYVTDTYEASATSCWGSTYGPGGVVSQALSEAESRCGVGKVCDISMEWIWYCDEGDCLFMSDGKMHYGCKGIGP